MSEQKIKIRVTETDMTMDVVVYSKRADKIEVVLGEGVHSVKCELLPTANGVAYVGSAMGREIVLGWGSDSADFLQVLFSPVKSPVTLRCHLAFVNDAIGDSGI